MRASTIVVVILIGVLWGLNWPAVKTLLGELPPITIRAVSLTTAGVLLGFGAWLRGDKLKPTREELGPLLLAGLLTVFGFNVLVTFGQILTETTRAAIIAYIMPALTAVFAVFLLGERLGPNRVIALVLAMLGVVVMASENLGHLLANPLGPLIMAGSAISWALGIIATKARSWTIGPTAQAVWFLGISALACWPAGVRVRTRRGSRMAIRSRTLGPSVSHSGTDAYVLRAMVHTGQSIACLRCGDRDIACTGRRGFVLDPAIR